jgi:chemotaxis signal transduction protein
VDEFRSGQYLTFRIGRQDLAIEAGMVKAIIPAHDLLSAEHPDPEWLVGESRLRGEPFPVIDLRLRLRLRHGISGRNPCIVVVHNGMLMGFLADSVSDIVRARAHDYRNGKLQIGRPRQIVPLYQLSL